MMRSLSSRIPSVYLNTLPLQMLRKISNRSIPSCLIRCHSPCHHHLGIHTQKHTYTPDVPRRKTYLYITISKILLEIKTIKIVSTFSSSNGGAACIELTLWKKTMINSWQNHLKKKKLFGGTGEWPKSGINWRVFNLWKKGTILKATFM